MRYLNWDVLLFPGGSRVPLQEFKTVCQAAHDPEMSNSSDMFRDFSPIPQIPIVACFVSDLAQAHPFKVSIHSWTTPELGNEDLRRHETERVVCLEVRVIIDGLCIGSIIVNPTQVYPQIIEHSFQVDKTGSRDLLRWPPFHQEILTQPYWNAGENMGRIKVTLAEGFVYGHHESPFIRTKNLVTFSFQHAPQDVLENAGIAWPNKGMWLAQPQQLYTITSTVLKKEEPLDPELHAHSPTRHASRKSFAGFPSSGISGAGASSLTNRSRVILGSNWEYGGKMADPFVDFREGVNNNHVVSNQQTLDVEHKLAGGLFSTKCSGGRYREGSKSVQTDGAATRNQSGLTAPSNTRANSAEGSGENTGSRHDSDVTMKSQFSEDHEQFVNIALSKPQQPPTGHVKSKKEGNSPQRESSSGGKVADASPNAGQSLMGNGSDSKRKRENATNRKVSVSDGLELAARKSSKHDQEDSPSTTADGRRTPSTSRWPLTTLNNVPA